MKKGYRIFLYIISILFVLFFSGVAVQSDNESHQDHLELSQGYINSEDCMCSDTDKSDEDQMDKVCLFYVSELPECHIAYISTLPPFSIAVSSVWQPPKVF